MPKTILIGAPIDSGQKRAGCLMGPAAYRVAGIAHEIGAEGHGIEDWGDLALSDLPEVTCPNPVVHDLAETVAWAGLLMDKVDDALSQGGFPIILGGDHSLALGSAAGAAAYAARQDRPLFLLWLDAHSDFHTPLTTTSGNASSGSGASFGENGACKNTHAATPEDSTPASPRNMPRLKRSLPLFHR